MAEYKRGNKDALYAENTILGGTSGQSVNDFKCRNYGSFGCGYCAVYRCCYFEDILYSKIWNDHNRGKCKLYQDIKLGGGSYEHEKMVSFVLTNRIYDVGFAGNVR